MARKRISIVQQPAHKEEDEDNNEEYSSEDEQEEEVSESEEEPSEDEGDAYQEKSSRRKASKKSSTTKKKSASKKKITKLSGGRTKLKTGKSDFRKRGGKSKSASTKKTPSAKSQSVLVRKEDKNSIFATVRRSYDAIDASVTDWIELYQEDAHEAIAALLNFVLHSSGCVTAQLSSDQIDDKKLPKLLTNFGTKFPATDDYPVVSSNATFKQFDKHFLCFWATLIEECSETVIFDEAFSEDFLSCLFVISSHSVRAFRHTATLAAYQIVDQLILSIKDQSKQLAKAEKQKKKSKKVKEHIDALNEQIETMKTIIDSIVQNVFHHRYKDVAADIRGLGMESLGGWVLKDSETFLSDQYLKYFGWLLNDKHPGVRELVLKFMLKIYAKDDWSGHLTKFTKRYLPRVVEMATEDLSVPVSVSCVQLLTLFLKHSFLEGVPKEDEYIASVESLLFDENASLRHYAAQFIQEHLLQTKERDSDRRSTGKEPKGLALKDYLQFMADHSVSVPNVASHVVDNFWEKGVFSEWKKMTDLLLQDNQSKSKRKQLSELDQDNVIRTMRAAVQKLQRKGERLHATSSHDTVKIKKSTNASLSKKKKKDLSHADQMDDMTAHLAVVLPQLLRKFQADSDKIQPLLEIPQFFSLESYDSHQLQQSFDELITLFKTLFWKHSDPPILSTIAKSFACFLKNEEYSLIDRAKQQFDALVREMEEKLTEAINEFDENAESDEENQRTLSIALERISNVVSVSDIQVRGIIDQLMRLLRARGDGAHIRDASTKSMMNIIFMTLCYRLQELVKQGQRTMSVTYEELYNMAMDFKTYMLRLVQLKEEDTYELRLAAYHKFCDLITLYNSHSKADSATLGSLRLRSDEDDAKNIVSFYEEALNHESKTGGKSDDDDMDTTSNDGRDTAASQTQEMQRELRKKMIVASIARAIIHGDLGTAVAPRILAQFATYDKSVTSCIKQFWHDLKSQHRYQAAQFEVDAMKVLFYRYMNQKEKGRKASIETSFEAFEKLGAKFAQTHFPGKDVEQVENVLRDAVEYALSGNPIESTVEFLRGFAKHANKLDASSSSMVKGYLQQQRRLLPDDRKKDESLVQYANEFAELLDKVLKKKGGRASSPARKEPTRMATAEEAAESDRESVQSGRSATRQLQFQSDNESEKSTSSTTIRKRKRPASQEKSAETTTEQASSMEDEETQLTSGGLTQEAVDAPGSSSDEEEAPAETSTRRRKRRRLV
uniref:SCD domain-containing protein n=1 Tax=Percolomonas cosmopolitus TaxID=63605 RepID=A0A6U0JE93_9EUKA|mmetsp:Transcript_10370/g.38458  ORF Transcript_10370/g.38458 Transcript_10370/m.38458 type:complete len:1233 (+) Transcript_10370:1395-5093(+)